MNSPAPEMLQLRDIHLPGTPGFWPPAPGWWVLSAVCLIVLVWSGRFVWRRWKMQRKRRQVLDLLAALDQPSGDTQPTEFLAQLSRLLRRIALMRFPRQEVAPLTGMDWLHFLDNSGGNGQFCHGPGRVLADGPYRGGPPGSVDTPALTRLVRDWIKKNTGA